MSSPLKSTLTRATTTLITLILLLTAGSAEANTVTFDLEPLGTTYGAPAGHFPGDWIMAEDSADLRVDEFFAGGLPSFNFSRIELPFMGFGIGQILELNNITVHTDFAAPGNTTFQFLDLGGLINIQVNGFGTVIEAPDFPSLGTFSPAPGVVMSTTWVPVGGGITGTVTLTGPVQHLRIGGQELWVDDLKCNNSIGGAAGPCLYAVDYETLPMGNTYGTPAGHSPGDWAFNEGGIDVYVVDFDAGGIILFNEMTVVPGFGPLGPIQVMKVDNISQLFDLAPLGITTTEVSFEYIDFGGTENLAINGSPLQIGDLHTFSGMTLGGVYVSVVTWPFGLGVYGEVTLTGNVQTLQVGGQEFWMDDVCVKGAPTGGPVLWCDHLSDIESPAIGSAWGGSYGNVPGDYIFTEDMMDVMIFDHTDPTGLTFFGDARVDAAFAPFGTSQILTMSSIGIGYDLAALGTVEKVRFDYFDGAGIENLIVNSAPIYIGEIDAAPTTIAPGITCTVYETAGPGFDYGTVVLEGNVQTFMIAGQQFAIDNVCVRLFGSSTDVSVMPRADVSLEPNYPNPFNPSTMLQFNLGQDSRVRLTIHDVAGRVIRTLIDEQRSGGSHSVVWDGQLDSGATASAGVYFVRVESREGVDTQKIALIK